MTWEFGDSLNWDLVERKTYYAQLISTDGSKFIPISPITILVDSYILLIGCRNTQAKPNWYLAGFAGSRLLFSPSSTSEFMSTVQSYPRVRLGLDRLNLVRFKDFNLTPFILEINVARWHKEMFIEVWKYSGQTDDIQPQLDRIEESINTNTGQ